MMGLLAALQKKSMTTTLQSPSRSNAACPKCHCSVKAEGSFCQRMPVPTATPTASLPTSAADVNTQR